MINHRLPMCDQCKSEEVSLVKKQDLKYAMYYDWITDHKVSVEQKDTLRKEILDLGHAITFVRVKLISGLCSHRSSTR